MCTLSTLINLIMDNELTKNILLKKYENEIAKLCDAYMYDDIIDSDTFRELFDKNDFTTKTYKLISFHRKPNSDDEKFDYVIERIKVLSYCKDIILTCDHDDVWLLMYKYTYDNIFI